ncbi:MAG: hypothetical protein KZQ99_04630 [Candidatus Thiodiazotropha sp. (ex Dulcina madagascariensis)]|nr:hypothetical protein [Candidatus Thiodiazotropha sp. (ex Dulcina madagascariensis)]
MRLVCPTCGAIGSLEMFLNDAAGRKALQTALALPHPLSKQLLVYLGLFRPGKRSLTWDRVEKILGELLEPIEAGKLMRKGRTFVVTTAIWQAALEALLAKRETLRLPLKTHGLLFEIAAGLADKAAAKHERDTEQARRQRPRTVVQNQPDGEDPNEANQAWKRTLKKYGREDLITETERGSDHE